MASRTRGGPGYHLASHAHHPARRDDLTALCHTAGRHICGPSDAWVSRFAIEDIPIVVGDFDDARPDWLGERSRSFEGNEGIAGETRLRHELGLDDAGKWSFPFDAREIRSGGPDLLIAHHGREPDHR